MQLRRSAMELMKEQVQHPRHRAGWEGFASGSCQSIGYLVDWLDGRPDEREADLVAIDSLWRLPVVVFAAALCGRKAGPRELWADDHRFDYDHRQFYSPFYHVVVGYLQQGELPRAQEVYGRLMAAGPCMSGFCNLAELHRRAGALVDCELMLREGLGRATLGGARHGIPDEAWVAQFRFALARLGSETSERVDEVLGLLGEGDAIDIGERLAGLRGDALLWKPERQAEDGVALAAHAAFARAAPAHRIVLAAAMRHAGIRPVPPPAAFASFEEASAADAALTAASAKRAEEYMRSMRERGRK